MLHCERRGLCNPAITTMSRHPSNEMAITPRPPAQLRSGGAGPGPSGAVDSMIESLQ